MNPRLLTTLMELLRPEGDGLAFEAAAPRAVCVDITGKSRLSNAVVGKPRVGTTITGKSRLSVAIEGHLCR